MTKITKGILLINLGSPQKIDKKTIRQYLNQFLMDKRVISINYFLRLFIVKCFILPFRPKSLVPRYKSILINGKSPLLKYTNDLAEKLQQNFKNQYHVSYAMRYGTPAIKDRLQKLTQQGINEIIICPLYPQYAAASTGSVTAEVYHSLKENWHIPTLKFIPPFYNNHYFIDIFVKKIKAYLLNTQYDHILFSYHGLPEDHLQKGETGNKHCLKTSNCCHTIGTKNNYCYKAQCFATTQKIVEKLNITSEKYSISFQSRLGRNEWIKPYTTQHLIELAQNKKENILVICPAFVADCLETLEEIEKEETENFINAGGKSLTLVKSLNAENDWVNALEKIITQYS